MVGKHYLKLRFGLDEDNSPEIYDFFFGKMEGVLKSMDFKEVRLEIKRLEPIDKIYTNVNKSKEEIMKIFDDFAKSHHLREKAALTCSPEKTSLAAKLDVEKLKPLLQDYNTLFDLFFADIVVEADNELRIEMMDGFSNTLLVSGPEKNLAKFRELTKNKLPKTKFLDVDRK